MVLTQEQRDVLAHIVENPQQWADHAENKFGLSKATEMLNAKVARWKPDYDSAISAGNYKNRATREAEIIASRQKTPLQLWEHQMRKADYHLIPRWAEDIISVVGTTGMAPETVQKYNDKQTLRGQKP